MRVLVAANLPRAQDIESYMTLKSLIFKNKYLQLQLVCLSQSTEPWHKTGLSLSLLGALLIGGVAVPDLAMASDRDSESDGRQAIHYTPASHYKKQHKHSHRHYRPYYRPYYPWGLGLGLGLATGWHLGYGSNLAYGSNQGSWNNDWRWRGERYWHSPYSGIGLSIPTGYDDVPLAISTPVRVTTSMQYSPDEGRMLSNMPSNSATVIAQANAGSLGIKSSNTVAVNPAAIAAARTARSVSTLPSNARIVQQDGRTLYEWQGTLYAFDWDSQTYQEQLVK